mgnify:CR=1 FL=1
MAHCSRYLRETKHSSPLLRHARDVTSQGGEDGILEELFRRLPMPSDGFPRSCIEVGSWDGKWLSNTYSFCAVQGWRGLLIEADAHRSDQAAAMYDALGCLRGQTQAQAGETDAQAQTNAARGVVCMTALVSIQDTPRDSITSTNSAIISGSAPGTDSGAQQPSVFGPCNVCGVPGPLGDKCHGWEIGEFHVGICGAAGAVAVAVPVVPTESSLANARNSRGESGPPPAPALTETEGGLANENGHDSGGGGGAAAAGSCSNSSSGSSSAAASLGTLLDQANSLYPQHIPPQPDLLSIGMYMWCVCV